MTFFSAVKLSLLFERLFRLEAPRKPNKIHKIKIQGLHDQLPKRMRNNIGKPSLFMTLPYTLGEGSLKITY